MKKNFTYNQIIKSLTAVLDKRTVDLSIKHIVIVPEKYTLLIEKAVFAHSKGAFDIEIMSLARLYQRLLGQSVLSKEGAVVAIKKILRSQKLKVYEKTKAFSGYATKLYKEIASLIMSGVSLKKLDTIIQNADGALKLKMQDIRLVYGEFLKNTEGMIVDRHGKLLALYRYLKAQDYFKQSYVYTINFDYKTVLEKEIFKTIKKRSLSFCELEIGTLSQEIKSPCEIYSASCPILAIKAAAKRIRLASLSDGVRFFDMAVVCDKTSHDGIRRVFSEFNIPFYIDEKPKLRDSVLAKYILAMLELKRVTRAGMIALAKNELANIEPDDICVFENYCEQYLVDYKGFYNEFLDERAESVRQKLVLLRDGFWGRGMIGMLDGVLDDSVEGIRIRELFDLSVSMGGDDEEFIVDTFKENLLTSLMTAISSTNDAVLVSSAAAFRGAAIKRAFILDANEGIIPPSLKSEGVLSSGELSSLGLDLAMLTKQKQDSEIKDIVSFMQDADKIFVAFVKNDEKRASPLLSSIEFKNARYNSDHKESLLMQEWMLGNKASALEYLLLNINSETQKPFVSELYYLLKHEADKFLQQEKESESDFCTHKNDTFFDKLFFAGGTTSISQLEEYYRCPFRHFAKYGLRIKENKSGEVDLLDAGNLVHKIAQEFVVAGFCEDKLKQALEKPFGYKFELSENTGKKERLTSVIEKLALRFKGHIMSGEAELLGTEIEVDSLILEGLRLVGKVDYADVLSVGDERFIRIIDYKSGRARFDKNEVLRGEKLQLALYALGFLVQGYKLGGAFYYPFKNRWLEKENRFSGFMTDDERVIKGLGGESVVDAGGKGMMSEDEAKMFLGEARKRAEEMIKSIRGGDIKRQASSDAVCKYCKFCIAEKV